MKKYIPSFLQIKSLTKKILLIVGLVGINHLAIAAGSPHITDEQIIRAARIAKATGTTITIVKETTTVTVHGGSKKTNKKVKAAVLKIMKSKKKSKNLTSPPNLRVAYSGYAGTEPPMLEDDPGVARPPVLDGEPDN